MTINKTNPNEFFSYPLGGIIVLSIFLVVVPPMELLTLVYFDHEWIGGRQLLIEIVDVFKNSFMPRFMLAYSFFMVQAVLAGFWCAFGVARGRGITLTKTINTLIVFGLGMEGLIQIILFLFQQVAFDWMRLLIAIMQAICAGFVCWFIIYKFKYNRSSHER